MKTLPLKEGQEILVQVVKDPFSTKGARLTTHISLAGRFIVYMPYDKHTGVSKKIEDQEERQRLKGLLKDLDFVKTGGFIIRTASHEKGVPELIRDAKFLYKIWQQIVKLAEQKQAPALIYKEYDLIWKIVRDYFSEHVEKLIIDSEEECLKVKKFVANLIGKEEVEKVHFYNDPTPLFESKGVSEELQKIYDTKVYLKSGAYVVIEPTEGLTVVDVNSGKFKTRATPEDAAFMVNTEAAPEIARQLRLRDVGGIIVIDFIDMSREGHKRKVIETLQQELTRDYAKTEVNRISSLGLVEMTRARTGKTLESISFAPCPYCDGRGKLKIE
jgi:ribonuclease G